jgi:hypothetical protein
MEVEYSDIVFSYFHDEAKGKHTWGLFCNEEVVARDNSDEVTVRERGSFYPKIVTAVPGDLPFNVLNWIIREWSE